MADTLSKTGIQDNSTIRTWHVTQSIDAFTKEKAYDITLSGSLTIDGDLNLKTNPTGNLQGYAAYSFSSSNAGFGLSASLSDNAYISNDTTVIQLHHGAIFPLGNKNYFFSINPIASGSTYTLPTASGFAGTLPPTSLTIVSASITTTVNDTTGSGEFSTYKLYQRNTLVHTFTNFLKHNTTISSSSTAINQTINDGEPIYIQWDSPSWVTPPKQVSHNVVLYCSRGLKPA